MIEVKVGNKNLQMEIDSGAGASVISEQLYHKYFKTCEIEPATVRLRTYNGNIVPVGQIQTPTKV